MFAKVSKVVHVKLEKFSVDNSLKAPKISEQITEMKEILEKEKTEFEVIPCFFSPIDKILSYIICIVGDV